MGIEQAVLTWFERFLTVQSFSEQELAGLRFLEESVDFWNQRLARPLLFERQLVTSGRYNLLAAWGKPKILFCTHVDTVPPLLPVKREGERILGRGSCDAKGQILTALLTAQTLLAQRADNFGLLFLVGEETGSDGAKQANRFWQTHLAKLANQRAWKQQQLDALDQELLMPSGEGIGHGVIDPLYLADVEQENSINKIPAHVAGATQFLDSAGAETLVVLEPTENRLIRGAKGALRVEVTCQGKAAHSGYPERGVDAVQIWALFNQALLKTSWARDPLLGETTFNWGDFAITNAANVIAEQVKATMFWRTTFQSAERLSFWLPRITQLTNEAVLKSISNALSAPPIHLKTLGESLPIRFNEAPGLPMESVAFGSDAPYLTTFKRKYLYGPGSIQVAHGQDEQIAFDDIIKAVRDLVSIYQYEQSL